MLYFLDVAKQQHRHVWTVVADTIPEGLPAGRNQIIVKHYAVNLLRRKHVQSTDAVGGLYNLVAIVLQHPT